MKATNIILLFTFLLFYQCKAQKNIPKKEEYKIINLEGKEDVVIFDITNGVLLPFHLFFQYSIEEGTHFADLSPQSTSMDMGYTNSKYFHFFNDDADMIIDCYCPRFNNYYLKNLIIKEGNYKLNFKKDIKIKGADIKVSDKTQNILFENVDSNKYSHRYENLYFKDLEFTVIDMADTLNVKLLKVIE